MLEVLDNEPSNMRTGVFQVHADGLGRTLEYRKGLSTWPCGLSGVVGYEESDGT